MDAHLQLVTTRAVSQAISHAKRVHLDAYVLYNPNLIDALEHAADRGADVEVRLCRDPSGGQKGEKHSRALAKELRRHGVAVQRNLRNAPGSVHDKIAIVDDRVFRDDRNWRSDNDETILCSDRLTDAVAQSKAEALASEVELLRRGRGHDVLVATESFGPGPVADALLARANRGDHVRLVYNLEEDITGRAEVLQRLRKAGVDVRCSSANHKIAVVGTSAWIGSANATRTLGIEEEWGTRVKGKVARELHACTEQIWSEAG